MYLQGLVTIDPSQLTEIHSVRPTKGFARVAHLLTGGLVVSKEERETFCAVTILQQVNIVMRSLGIDDIIRLVKDDTIIYEDKEGREGDLREALNQFATRVTSEAMRSFDTLNLVLEHATEDLKLLIDIRVFRSHDVGEHPIEITINGLARELGGDLGEDDVRGKMQNIFGRQSDYDDFVTQHKASFDAFLGKLEEAFHKHMNIDEMEVESSVKIIRPRRQADNTQDQQHSGSYNDPVYEDHHGVDAAFLYAWLWSEHCHENDIHCRDVTVVDGQGREIFEVGEEGFQAGGSDTLNINAEFVLPESADIEVFGDHDFGVETADSRLTPLDVEVDDTRGGWFSSISESLGSFDFGGDSGDGGGWGGSSCGGGCGGGCGGD